MLFKTYFYALLELVQSIYHRSTMTTEIYVTVAIIVVVCKIAFWALWCLCKNRAAEHRQEAVQKSGVTFVNLESRVVPPEAPQGNHPYNRLDEEEDDVPPVPSDPRLCPI
ncbi:hypothetical protein EB796_024941 [Bugula neritina]|uniref:Uncharacterized protein n=1 Tax=Bugula neritina TaxID=10212 RepID=A0A7J7IT91_BUGNE|nr:hypothetical protein EB796_024941 [Bugula neritina]